MPTTSITLSGSSRNLKSGYLARPFSKVTELPRLRSFPEKYSEGMSATSKNSCSIAFAPGRASPPVRFPRRIRSSRSLAHSASFSHTVDTSNKRWRSASQSDSTAYDSPMPDHSEPSCFLAWGLAFWAELCPTSAVLRQESGHKPCSPSRRSASPAVTLRQPACA